MQLFTKQIPSIVGKLTLVAHDKALVAILWEHEKPGRVKLGEISRNESHPLLQKTEQELMEYFSGHRNMFDIPLEMIGSDFQQKVWQALRTISYGNTLTYAEVADHIGSPRAVRAVGTAIGRNPISIIIPCHRVIGKQGQLTGFAGGLQNKSALLKLESKHYSTCN